MREKDKETELWISSGFDEKLLSVQERRFGIEHYLPIVLFQRKSKKDFQKKHLYHGVRLKFNPTESI